MEIPEELVLQAQGGDPGAIAEVYQGIQPIVARTVRRLERDNPSTAEELILHALLHILEQGIYNRRFREGNFAAWATTVAHNATVNQLELERRRPVLGPQPTSVEAVLEHRSSGLTVEAVAINNQAADRIVAMLDIAGVTEKFRRPFLMHYAYGVPIATIAETLGMKRGTVLSEIFRAKQAIREYYGIIEDTRPWDIFEDPTYTPERVAS